jgi:hypothetical protein
MECGAIYDLKVNRRGGRSGHICGERWCNYCGSWHDPKRGCYITPLEPRKLKNYRVVVYDVETTQNHPVDIDTPNANQQEHHVNFIGARVACRKCIRKGLWRKTLKKGKKCKVCGKNRTVTFGHRSFTETTVDKHHITTEDKPDSVVEAFFDWLLGLSPSYQSQVFAHNGGRFDHMFILHELYKRKIIPEIISRGNKIFELRVEEKWGKQGESCRPTTVFWDSYNLLSRPLAALVPMFDLDVKEKPFFPIFYNKIENYGKRLSTLPPMNDYPHKGFMPPKKREFVNFYDEHYNDGFFLDEALPSYCMNDVDILMEALVAFRGNFMEVTKRKKKRKGFQEKYSQPHSGIDPLRETMTIASSSMRNYRLNYLPEKHLARVTDMGYTGKRRQSTEALKFLRWYGEENNVHVQYAHSPGGEKKIGDYWVDGYIEAEKKIIEYHGCWYHGCPHCFKDEQTRMKTGKTAGWHRERDAKRENFIKSLGFKLEVYWGCQVKAMLEKDKNMKEKFDAYLDRGPINVRKAFYGGRTGPLKLFRQPDPEEEISYADVTSLYPYTNMMLDKDIRGYPVGIPVEDTPDEPRKVHWTKPEDHDYKLALLKVFVIPPRQIKIPVLPMKLDKDDDERLLFPLCSTCARENKQGGVEEDYECQHTDEERGWMSECTSVELDVALKRGYVVTEFVSALVFEKEDRKLFRGYMRDCLAGKIHATGFDPDIKGNYEEEEKFIKECKQVFGLKIDRKKMKPNKGLRETEKFRANTLWGRFGLRNYGLTQTLITDDIYEIRNLFNNSQIDLISIDDIATGVYMLTYLEKKEWTDAHESSNVFISLWTTSCARLHLLKWMEKIIETPGCELLYTDTDSVIYIHPKGQNPLQFSSHLGGLTNEYPKHDILEFSCGGSKQYGLKLQPKNNPSADYDYVLKIRGQTLSEDVMENQGLRYETFKENIQQYVRTGHPPQIPVLYPNFLRPNIKKGTVISAPLTKIYKPFVAKGIVRPSDFKVLDFGYTQ